jgi:hypothetical protein
MRKDEGGRMKDEGGRFPLTHDEVEALIPILEEDLAAIEAEHEDARPLPAMTAEESKGRLLRLIGVATTRPLTRSEDFLCGQLLACYAMAIRAEMLGKKGRYFVVSEDDIADLLG